MPFSSEMLRRLTIRLGVVRYCLSEVTRSVPPARISVSPHLSLSSAVASFNVVGAAYSNDFMRQHLPSAKRPEPGQELKANVARARQSHWRRRWQWPRRAK